MKKCALACVLVVGLGTVAWGDQVTGICIVPANSFAMQPLGIAITFHNYVSGLACHQTPICTVPSGCHFDIPENPCHEWHWSWPHCGGNDNPSTTTASSSTSTQAGGPVGNAVADAASSSTTAHSSSTSTSHSQSTVLSN